MKKNVIKLLTGLCVLMLGLFAGKEAYAYGAEMTLHGIYLGENSKGDSVLLESQGEYLLMDIGMYYGTPYVIEELEDLGIDHLSIYFSHLHMDHTGSCGTYEELTDGLQEFADAGITIDKLYLPAENVAPRSINNPTRYRILKEYAEGKFPIQYLKVGDTLYVGDAVGRVIGPVDEAELSLLNARGEYAYGTYENNCSLVTIFTCGNIKYFTAGDIAEAEEKLLIKRYGSELDCDIMKLNHHGQGKTNTEELLSYITPTYSFTTTPSYEPKKENGKWKNYRAVARSEVYGINYMIQPNRDNIVIEVKNDSVRLYRGEDAYTGKRMKGWVQLAGSDGRYHDTDWFYLDSYGELLTGIQQIDGLYYNFGTGGRMVSGKYKENGYKPWVKDENGTRAYLLDEQDRAVMQVGFAYVGEYRYFFDKQGYRLEPKEEDVFTTIRGDEYILEENGAFRTDEIVDMDDGTYYLDTSGRMVYDEKLDISGTLYLFDGDGRMIGYDGKRDFYRFNGQMYAINGEGEVLSNCIATVQGHKYYFDEEGIFATDEKVKRGASTYYFNKKGYMVTKKLVRIDNNRYYFGADGKMYTDRNFKLNGKKYHADEDGVVKRVKKVKKEKEETE